MLRFAFSLLHLCFCARLLDLGGPCCILPTLTLFSYPMRSPHTPLARAFRTTRRQDEKIPPFDRSPLPSFSNQHPIITFALPVTGVIFSCPRGLLACFTTVHTPPVFTAVVVYGCLLLLLVVVWGSCVAARRAERADRRRGAGQRRRGCAGVQAAVAVSSAHHLRRPQEIPRRLPQPLQGEMRSEE